MAYEDLQEFLEVLEQKGQLITVEEQVMWALTTSVRPNKDVVLIPYAPGMPLDPSSEPAGMHTKLIIDATTPVAPDELRDTELLYLSEKTNFWMDYLKNEVSKVSRSK